MAIFETATTASAASSAISARLGAAFAAVRVTPEAVLSSRCYLRGPRATG